MSKTTLWYVSYINSKGIIEVSDQPLWSGWVIRIRSITPTAAGRRYRKFNLPSILVNIDHEWDNPMAPNGPPEDEKEELQLRKDLRRKWHRNPYKGNVSSRLDRAKHTPIVVLHKPTRTRRKVKDTHE